MSPRPNLSVLLCRDEIDAAVKRLAIEIRKDYKDKNPLLIGILKGSFIFMADLVRYLNFPLEIDFIGLSSYGSGTESSGKVKIFQRPRCLVKGRHVVVVEDIIDTGITVAFLLDYLKRKKPASLKLCVLIDKTARRQVPMHIDYLGITIPDRFIVGYGTDWNEKYRYLPDIRFVDERK